jgi:repressor LexA
MNPMTKAQERVLNFIKAHVRKNGYPPTRGEIAQHFGWSSKTAAQQHLEALQSKGEIKIAAGLSRGITVCAA